eukprot:6186106-Prymnesium_polylepis.1
MLHECCPCRLVCSARARRTVSPRPSTPPVPGAPRRRLDACTLARPAASAPRVCSVQTPRRPRGAPSPGAACGGAPDRTGHRPVASRGAYPQPRP